MKLNLKDVVADVQKLYGKNKAGADMIGTGTRLKRPTEPEDFILAPEGHPWIELTGLLGLPYDCIIQVAGDYDSGKSTLAGEFMAAAQKQNIYVILGDSEKKFDKVRFAKHFGGDPDQIFTVQSTMIRKLAGGMFKFIKVIMEKDPKARILLVHDSVGGSVSKARAEHDIDDDKGNQPGSEAVENSDYMKHMIAIMDKYPGAICLLLINQMTDKIGFGMKGKSRSGGHKISFHSSLIIEMKQIKKLLSVSKGKKLKKGIISKVTVNKNHLGTGDAQVDQMNIMIDASGWHMTDFTFDKEDDTQQESKE